MARSLSALFEDADAIISSRVSGEKTASAIESGDDIFKMAEWVRKSGEQVAIKEASSTEEESSDVIVTLAEKLAHAKAFLETYQNLPTLVKMASFEKNAKARGFSDEQIEAYLGKNASDFPLKSVL